MGDPVRIELTIVGLFGLLSTDTQRKIQNYLTVFIRK